MEPVKEITPSKLITKKNISWTEIKTAHIKADVVEYNFDARCSNIHRQRFANRFNWVFNIVLISVLSLTKLLSSTGDLQLQKTSCITKKKNLEVLNEERTKKVKSDHRSKFFNLSNWKEEAYKISGLQRASNPWPPQYQCDAWPTELWSFTLGASYMLPCSEMMWNICEIHIRTAVVDESEEWSSQ